MSSMPLVLALKRRVCLLFLVRYQGLACFQLTSTCKYPRGPVWTGTVVWTTWFELECQTEENDKHLWEILLLFLCLGYANHEVLKASQHLDKGLCWDLRVSVFSQLVSLLSWRVRLTKPVTQRQRGFVSAFPLSAIFYCAIKSENCVFQVALKLSQQQKESSKMPFCDEGTPEI